MAISYALFENHLTSDPDDYAAQVKIAGSAGLEVIAQRMIDQGSTVTKAETVKPEPALLQYVGLGSGETNGKITSGNIGTINGHRLKFNPDQDDNGIYFVNVDTAARSR
jgi:hypothetical protein